MERKVNLLNKYLLILEWKTLTLISREFFSGGRKQFLDNHRNLL